MFIVIVTPWPNSPDFFYWVYARRLGKSILSLKFIPVKPGYLWHSSVMPVTVKSKKYFQFTLLSIKTIELFPLSSAYTTIVFNHAISCAEAVFFFLVRYTKFDVSCNNSTFVLKVLSFEIISVLLNWTAPLLPLKRVDDFHHVNY